MPSPYSFTNPRPQNLPFPLFIRDYILNSRTPGAHAKLIQTCKLFLHQIPCIPVDVVSFRSTEQCYVVFDNSNETLNSPNKTSLWLYKRFIATNLKEPCFTHLFSNIDIITLREISLQNVCEISYADYLRLTESQTVEIFSCSNTRITYSTKWSDVAYEALLEELPNIGIFLNNPKVVFDFENLGNPSFRESIEKSIKGSKKCQLQTTTTSENPAFWTPKYLVAMFPENNKRIINNYFSFSTSMLVHILLLFVIIRHTPKIFRPYQKVLFLHLVMNFYYTFVGLLMQSNMVYDRKTNVFFVQIDALIKNPPIIITVIMTAFNDFGSLWYISALPVNYVYRYFLICRNSELPMLYFIGLLLLSVIAPLFIAILNMINFWPDSTYAALNQATYESYGHVIAITKYRTLIDVYAASIPLLIAFYYAIITVTFIAITFKMKSLKKLLSKTSASMQSQITIILIVQAGVPLVMNVLPPIALCLSWFIGFDTPNEFSIFGMVNAWTPCINGLTTLLVIKPYRQYYIHAILKVIYRKEENIPLFRTFRSKSIVDSLRSYS